MEENIFKKKIIFLKNIVGGKRKNRKINKKMRWNNFKEMNISKKFKNRLLKF